MTRQKSRARTPEQNRIYADLAKAVGPRLKEAREKARYSTADVVAILGISSSGYRSYESGMVLVPLNYLLQLCQLFDVSLDDILDVPTRAIEDRMADAYKDGFKAGMAANTKDADEAVNRLRDRIRKALED